MFEYSLQYDIAQSLLAIWMMYGAQASLMQQWESGLVLQGGWRPQWTDA